MQSTQRISMLTVRPSFFFCFTDSFSQVRFAGRNKNKIHSDHFPTELKSKPSILIQLENGLDES